MESERFPRSQDFIAVRPAMELDGGSTLPNRQRIKLCSDFVTVTQRLSEQIISQRFIEMSDTESQGEQKNETVRTVVLFELQERFGDGWAWVIRRDSLEDLKRVAESTYYETGRELRIIKITETREVVG